ncbi:RDH54 [Candida oxycetoniae]|uniref:RDH54 n=1 Tax=Candida oxycetoniae TaxID=497107 RepID=A0AAI9SX22_9ASCO|nr:RDH54 [Candida oxycetoniae]KAI3404330.2 RDH54 [Candida oxycetoniae]
MYNTRPNAAFKPPRIIGKDENSVNGVNGVNNASLSAITKRYPGLKRVNRNASESPTKKVCSSASASASDCNEVTKYIVQWRKKTNKKNKSWDGDGKATVKLVSQGCEIVLKNSDGKIMSKKTFNQLLNLNDVIPIGLYEIILDEKIETDTSPTRKSNLSCSDEMQSNPSLPKSFIKVAPTNHEETLKKHVPLYDTKENEFQLIPPPSEEEPVKVTIDPHLASKLRPHQVEGVSFMYECVMGFRDFEGNGCLLADEMGLGKTLMAVTTIWTLLKQNPYPNQKKTTVDKVLIVCPVTLISNWKHEFKKWLGSNKLNILTLNNPMSDDKRDIINFGKLHVYQVLIINYEKILAHFDELSTVNFDLLVCDEGHRLKNSSNKVLINLKKLNIPKKIILTGTPIQNYLEEFHTLISFINPSVLPDIKTFQRKFILPITQARDKNCFNTEIKRKGEELSKELIRLTHKFILRRTQSLLENYLTSKTDILLFVPPTRLQLDLFELVKKSDKFNQLDCGSISLALINVFRKICNSPSLLSTDEFFHKITSNNNNNLRLSTSSGKINALIPLLLEIVSLNEKTVLISNYTKTLDLLELVLKKLNLHYTRLDGSTPNNMRNKLVTEFNSSKEIHVFLLSSKSGGMGINLVGASRLILFDNDWNPSTDLQSMSRIHRDGQSKPCYIYRLFTAGCIDEKIFQRQLVKNKLSSKFLDNDSASKTDVFEQEDLKKIFEVDSTTISNTHDLLECPCHGDGSSLTQDEVLTDDNDESEEFQVKATQSWVSATELQQTMKQNVDVEKNIVRSALNDYQHYDPEVTSQFQFDNVLQKMFNNQLSDRKFPITFVMKKSTG